MSASLASRLRPTIQLRTKLPGLIIHASLLGNTVYVSCLHSTIDAAVAISAQNWRLIKPAGDDGFQLGSTVFVLADRSELARLFDWLETTTAAPEGKH